MSIYAKVKINLKDGRQFGTSDITQGSIRDAVLDIMNHFPSERVYRSITISNESNSLDEIANIFKDSVIMEFDAIYNLDEYNTEVIHIEDYNRNNFDLFKKIMLADNVEAYITQDEYSSAFLPSWTQKFFENDLNNKYNIPLFIRYCELFIDGKILFGVQTKNIESIELTLV